MALVPYEFLVRWNHQTGELQGAHVKLYDSVTKKEGDAQSVAVAGAAGFPLSTILTAIEQGAIITADAAVAQVAEKEALLEKREASILALSNKIKAAEATIATLTKVKP